MLGLAAWMMVSYVLAVFGMLWVIGGCLLAVAILRMAGVPIHEAPGPVKDVLRTLFTWMVEFGWPIFAAAAVAWALGWMIVGIWQVTRRGLASGSESSAQ